MSILFEPIKIKNMELRNRFVRSATGDGCADREGHITEAQVKIFAGLAAGGIGLILSGATFVHPYGRMGRAQTGISCDDRIPGLKKLTATVHDQGGKIAVQLVHAGREGARLLNARNEKAIGPSLVDDDPYFQGEYRPMTEDEIWETIGAFGDAAKRAMEADFDAVQIHGAHAYLLSQFLSPFTNRRSDDWGGSLENRLRLHREIYRSVRAKVGEDYPVLIKVGVQDVFPGGLKMTEGKRAAQLLAQWGFDALEISQGLRGEGYADTEFRTKINSVDREAYFRDWCKEIKRQVNVPVMMVGGLRSFELMEEVVQKKEADFISLCRPFIREPGIVNEWKAGKHLKASCISCNKCFEALRRAERIRCFQQGD